jgi:hypothetical protein
MGVMSTLDDLQAWYHGQCSGDWEHAYGVKIETLDNPGWSVRIDLTDTLLEGRPFEPVRRGDSDDPDDADWLDLQVADGRFVGHGGALQLETILRAFLDWAKALPADQSSRADWLDTPSDLEQSIAADRRFRDALGDEVGPELCRQEGCDRRRIRNSVFCRRHHYEQVTRRPYGEGH